MSSFNTPSPLDNLMLQTLMGRLHIRSPNISLNSQSLEDILLEAVNNNISQDESDDSDDDNRTLLSKEESKLEKEIINTILSGKTDSLKPNSGQAVTIGEHHVCVGFHEEKDSDYRVWEWHGHLMLFDEEHHYTPEYIYGNYFERFVGSVKSATHGDGGPVKEEEDNEEPEKLGNLGLRELINGGDSDHAARILHRASRGN